MGADRAADTAMNGRWCICLVVLLLPSIAHAQIVSGRVTDQARLQS